MIRRHRHASTESRGWAWAFDARDVDVAMMVVSATTSDAEPSAGPVRDGAMDENDVVAPPAFSVREPSRDLSIAPVGEAGRRLPVARLARSAAAAAVLGSTANTEL